MQLLDSRGGRQIWADRYDVTAGNLFAVQDQIADRIASALAIGVDRTRLEAAQRTPLTSLDAYDCWLRGFDCLQTGTVEADAEARRFFERALETDPTYARAYAGLSLSHFNEWSCQAWHKWDETERLAYDYADRAAQLDDADAIVLLVWGDRDAYALRSAQERLLDVIPGARLMIYEGFGHAIHWEDPVRVTKDLVTFLEGGSLSGRNEPARPLAAVSAEHA